MGSTDHYLQSICLTPEEANQLATLVHDTAYSEAALMRQWVISGMERFRIEEAIRAYQEGHVDLQGAAKQAQVAVLLEEMAVRKVAVLDQDESFGPGLEALRTAFEKSDADT